MNLAGLDALFRETVPTEIAAAIEAAPAGAAARRLWFLYEWLTGEELDVPELRGRLEFVPILDPETQVALADGVPSVRHRVIDNLPGTRRFCPLVRRTPALRAAASRKFDSRAREILWNASGDERKRVSDLLQLRDARASFALAGMTPSAACEARWADAIGQAGIRSLSSPELERLQRLCSGDARAARSRTRRTRAAQSPDDGESVFRGIVDFVERALRGSVDPVIVAAAAAFGFANLQPSRPQVGLIHRWLVHHVLDAAGYRPPDAVLPISTAFERAGDRYARLVERPSDCSPYFDATAQAEFLYACVEQSVEQDLRLAVRASNGGARVT